MTGVRVGTGSIRLTDDNMAQLGADSSAFDMPWEGELRASALLLDAGEKILFISVDALIVPVEVTAKAINRISEATGIPRSNILICATHTHSAPCPIDFLGCTPSYEYIRRIGEGCLLAALEAVKSIEYCEPDIELYFGKSQEATVGRNSRLLLKDGTVGWYGYEAEDVVRPTGPYDPDLYVLAAKHCNGTYAGLAFNHSVHNLGKIRDGHYSPCFNGLTAQEIEHKHLATCLFFPGAFGSTHNVTYNDSGVHPAECVHRLSDAINDAMNHLEPALPGPVKVINRPFTYHLRKFDEEKESAAVKYYMEKYDPKDSAYHIDIFRQMREEMAPRQGEAMETRLLVIRLGNIAYVGIPGEMFARLGLEIKRRSPFRHTCLIGLANEEIGYIPDIKAYSDGGYQTWVGWHSKLEPGTGEKMVDQAVQMLEEAM